MTHRFARTLASRTTVAQLALVAVLLLAAAAQAQTTPTQPDAPEAPLRLDIQERTLRVMRGDVEVTSLALPCAAIASAVIGQRALVACGPEGLVVVDLSAPEAPTILGHHVFGASVTGTFEADGRVWVRLAREEARPLDAAAPPAAATPLSGLIATTAPTSSATPTAAATDRREYAPELVGVVVEAGEGRVVIDLGSEAGLARQDHVELFVEVERKLGDGQVAMEERRLSVGVVAAVSEGRASIDLGINEEVPAGAKARKTNVAPASNLMPRRADGLWEIGFMARPFLALGTLGFGTVSQVWAAYRMERPIVVRALIEPLGLGFAESGNLVAAAGNIVVGYDTQLFEVGLGLGWSAINSKPGSVFGSSDTDSGSGGSEPIFEAVNSSLSIVQSVRLGARDGLALMANNGFVLYDGEFRYGGTSGLLQFPTTESSWLQLGGGGGFSGYWYFDIGVRILMTGNGERGSLFMNASLGGAGLFGELDPEPCEWDARQTCEKSVDYAGPAAGIGLEWRL